MRQHCQETRRIGTGGRGESEFNGGSPATLPGKVVPMEFSDRTQAGQLLAAKLGRYAGRPDTLVLALPRGGVPVGAVVAQALHAPLDVLVVRKLGLPGNEELAMGAVSAGGVRVLNASVMDSFGVSDGVIEHVAARESREVERREQAYRRGRPAPEVHGKYVILVDDGIATGSTMRAAIAVLRELQAGHIVVAVPVAARDSYLELRRLADEFVALLIPRDFGAVGQFYADFGQTGDAEVRRLLEAGTVQPAASAVEHRVR